MEVTVFHGSPRKGNTYRAATIFMEEMKKHDDVNITEFFLPRALPEFCTGCQTCLSSPSENCPHAVYVGPILAAILKSEALIFTSPHFSRNMSGAMKNLLDHLDFLTMNIAPQESIFRKRAFIITTGTGSKAAIRPIKGFIRNWGINRVYSYGIRMYTNKWDMMPTPKQAKHEHKLRRAAGRFYNTGIKRPYISSIFMYHVFRSILRKYVGEGAYPFEYWKQHGFFKRRPF